MNSFFELEKRFVVDVATFCAMKRMRRKFLDEGAQSFSVAALTNTFDGMSLEAFEQFRPDLDQHLNALFGTSVIQSHLVGMRKPNSNVFQHAASHFNVDPTRVLFIDDEAFNCEGARAVGMTAIHNVDADLSRLSVRSALGM